MLLVWQGREPGRRWQICESRVDVSGLRDALKDYWISISNRYPNVSALEIVVIDLTLRAIISDR